MRNLFVMLALLCSANAAHAITPDDWFAKMDQYRVDAETWSNEKLFWHQLGVAGKVGLGCGGSAVATGVAFVTDTIPLTNPVAEWVANKSNAKYQSFQDFWAWQTLAEAGRGATGGALMAGYESLEWVMMWLKGDTQGAFEQLKKIYESSWATKEAMFSLESACWTNIVKVAVLRSEARRRYGLPRIPANYTPMHVP